MAAAAHKLDLKSDDEVEVGPDEAAELEQAVAEAAENKLQGKLIPAADFLEHLRRTRR